MLHPLLQKKLLRLEDIMQKKEPLIHNIGSQAINQLSTKVRPNKRYKTDRKDLDGGALARRRGPSAVDKAAYFMSNFLTPAPSFAGLATVLAGQAYKGVSDNINYYRGSGIIDSLLTSGVKGSPWQVDIKKRVKLLTDPVNKMPVADAKKLVQYHKDQYKLAKQRGYGKSYNTFVKEMNWGRGLDIHKWIGKLQRPKAGWTPGNYKYMGPYNPLDKQLTCDPKAGEVLEWKAKPYNKVDKIAAYHDICSDMGNNKGECDKYKRNVFDKGYTPNWTVKCL